MRTTSFVFAAAVLLGCTSSNTPVSPGSGGRPGTGGSVASSTGGAGTGGAGTGGAGTGGTTGTGGAGTGGLGTGGSSGASGGTDGGALPVVDSGSGPRDVVSPDSTAMARQIMRPIGMPYPQNGYWEYLPPSYGDGTKRPLLVFWHGSGENGSGNVADLARILIHGPPKLINMNLWPADRPFIVLSPQHAGAGATLCPNAQELRDFLTFALGRYDVDPAHVYLTGLSCGGTGGWAYLGQYRGEVVAAAALIASNSGVAYAAAGCALLGQVAIWSFHGGADNPAADTAGMANFMACPQPRKDAKFTLFPNTNHQGSWEKVYDDAVVMNDVVAWLLLQAKP
jgi:predicted esterase